ncbi:MAG: hypothetical protein GKR88_14410 [Flavobacteriaceae bacterium]|nr:MAG: hypothetical protein GKR88_14410 [Flavobacteriaceae bacterium]
MMRKAALKIGVTAIGLLFISTAGFLLFQQSALVQEQQQQQIIGTWVIDDDANYKIKFVEVSR